jgi:hypothetical protein
MQATWEALEQKKSLELLERMGKKVEGQKKSYVFRRNNGGIIWWINRTYGQIRKRSKEITGSLPTYSNQEFRDWIFNNHYRRNRLMRIYSKWVLNNFDTKDIPSIDRINDYKGYGFDNIRITVWRINNLRGRLSEKTKAGIKRSGEKSTIRQGIPVDQYTSDGVFIARHKSMAKASLSINRHINKVGQSIKRGMLCAGFQFKISTTL